MVLHSAYMTLPLQILGSIVYFSIVAPARNERFFLACALALVVTTIASAVFPAAGPFIDFGNTQNDTLYFTQVLSVRTGAQLRFDLGDLQGIICFPSYHTILAIIFVMSHAGLRWSFYPVLALNAVMLVSIPSEGGHYLVDMLGGLPVALGSMAAAKWASARLASPGSDQRRFRARHRSHHRCTVPSSPRVARCTTGMSLPSNIKPSGSIQSPSTGRNHSNPPATKSSAIGQRAHQRPGSISQP